LDCGKKVKECKGVVMFNVGSPVVVTKLWSEHDGWNGEVLEVTSTGKFIVRFSNGEVRTYAANNLRKDEWAEKLFASLKDWEQRGFSSTEAEKKTTVPTGDFDHLDDLEENPVPKTAVKPIDQESVDVILVKFLDGIEKIAQAVVDTVKLIKGV
jgi:hypothetical protein